MTYILGLAVITIAVLLSCSARRNNAQSRFYHSLNSKYNIYYNGKISFDQALKAQNEGYKESYTERINMFPVSGLYTEEKAESGGAFDRAIDKGNKAIRLHSIKEKPPRKAGWQSDPKQVKLQKQEEYNPFMKHCWMLIAESQYYNGDFLQAAVTFSYITRHFATEEDLVARALIWQARCYTELNWAYEVNNALKKLNETGIPPKLQKEYDRMYANYMIRSGKDTAAIPYLEKAIKSQSNKRQKARWRYLLGQINQELGNKDAAYRAYEKTASMNPPYELEFAARIRETEVVTNSNSEKILKMLRRMSKSDKNKDYLDQVYYAIGNIYMSRQDTAKAIESYSEGIEKSTQNGLEKAVCQISLGDIYYSQKDYINAQPCYSGAVGAMKKEYKDYARVSKLSETLDELVVYYEAVHLQDSLQVLAKMPEKERLEVIDKIIADIIEAEKKAEEETEKEEYLANQQAMGSNIQMRRINMPTMNTGGGSSFYFYNPQTVAQGKNQFQQKWGKRTLEDNWRRRNKKMALIQDENGEPMQSYQESEMTEEMLAKQDSLQAIQDSLMGDPKSREYYLQQIPLTEEDMESSNIIIADGLFNMGMIYKDKLENMDLSVETFRELERRFPDNKYKLDYYYNIYLMALRYKDTALAEEFKNKMIAEFPESDYTKAVSDPNYEHNIRMMGVVQDSLYETTYEAFLAEDVSAVRNNYKEFSTKYPLGELMPKFMFLNALTYVQEGDADSFKTALTELTEKFPSADVSELANEMLKGLLRGRKLMQGSFSTMTWDLRFGVDDNAEIDSTLSFSENQDGSHRMLLLFTTGSIDKNQLLYAVAAYNFANFRIKGFDLSFEDMRSLTIMTISGFSSLKEVTDYYNMIYGEGGYAKSIDDVVTFFPFSDENYDILMKGKTLEEYMSFFVEHFGETAPRLINRWRVRVDSDRERVAEEERNEREAREKREAEEKLNAVEAEIEQTESKQKNQETPVEKTSAKSLEEQIDERIKQIEVEEKQKVAENPEPELSEEERDEIEHPKAKSNIFRKLFKKMKERDDFKRIQKSVEDVKSMAESAIAEDSTDTVTVEETKPLERVDGELTYEQLQEIRRAENEEKAVREAEAIAIKEEEKKTAEELKKQKEKDKEQLRKDKEKERKKRLKQKKQESKEKAKASKARRKEKEKQRKEKEKARKAAQKQKQRQKKK